MDFKELLATYFLKIEATSNTDIHADPIELGPDTGLFTRDDEFTASFAVVSLYPTERIHWVACVIDK